MSPSLLTTKRHGILDREWGNFSVQSFDDVMTIQTIGQVRVHVGVLANILVDHIWHQSKIFKNLSAFEGGIMTKK